MSDYDRAGVRVDALSEEVIERIAQRAAKATVARLLRVVFVSLILGTLLFGTLGYYVYDNRNEIRDWFQKTARQAQRQVNAVSPLR